MSGRQKKRCKTIGQEQQQEASWDQGCKVLGCREAI